MILEAFKYQELEEDDTYLLRNRIDSCMITPSISALMGKVRATKCVYLVNYFTAESDLEIILDPSQYYALKGQLVNPMHNISKSERSDLARLLNRKDCLIRIRN